MEWQFAKRGWLLCIVHQKCTINKRNPIYLESNKSFHLLCCTFILYEGSAQTKANSDANAKANANVNCNSNTNSRGIEHFHALVKSKTNMTEI